MGFVKTAEEIAAIEHALHAVEFNGGEFLGVDFMSDPEFIRATLPPGLEPAATPRMSAMACRFAGGSCGSFAGGAVYIAARRGAYEGNYTLAMYMNNDNAMLFGRDIIGEPKKLAEVEYAVNGALASGRVSRGGATLIAIDAELNAEAGKEPITAYDFNYKMALAADGIGLAADPQLTLAQLDLKVARHRTGTASLRLGGTVHDPLHEIPVRELLGARLIEADFDARCRVLATVPAADFLPYAYGRMPDWSVFFRERASRGRARAA